MVQGHFNPERKGSFLVTSSKVVKYLFILYSYDANKKISDSINSRMVKDILQAYTICHDYLKDMGYIPKIHWLYNWVYNSLKK